MRSWDRQWLLWKESKVTSKLDSTYFLKLWNSLCEERAFSWDAHSFILCKYLLCTWTCLNQDSQRRTQHISQPSQKKPKNLNNKLPKWDVRNTRSHPHSWMICSLWPNRGSKKRRMGCSLINWYLDLSIPSLFSSCYLFRYNYTTICSLLSHILHKVSRRTLELSRTLKSNQSISIPSMFPLQISMILTKLQPFII